MIDHVHMMMSIPPRYSVSQLLGYMKGKSAIQLRGPTTKSAAILWGSIFGHAATGSRPETIMRQP